MRTTNDVYELIVRGEKSEFDEKGGGGGADGCGRGGTPEQGGEQVKWVICY